MENIYIDYLIPEHILLIYHNSTDYLLQYVSSNIFFVYIPGRFSWLAQSWGCIDTRAEKWPGKKHIDGHILIGVSLF